MVVLADFDTRTKVEKMMEDGKIKGDIRTYLGVSSIGDPCTRKLWYSFRWVSAPEQITKRQNRLFGRGHKEEPIIVADLEACGMEHYDDQDECIACHGHVKGHCDGKLRNVPDAPKTPHLAEFKTANDKNFAKAKKDKVKLGFPVYYAQMVVYMYLFGLKRALFIMVNKNTDERYYERIKADNKYAKELLLRAEDIIMSEIPPEKRFKSTYFSCKWCLHYNVCHFGLKPQVNCRTCNFCDIHNEGKWACSLKEEWLDKEDQLAGCSSHRLLEGLKV